MHYIFTTPLFKPLKQMHVMQKRFYQFSTCITSFLQSCIFISITILPHASEAIRAAIKQFKAAIQMFFVVLQQHISVVSSNLRWDRWELF